MSNKFPGSGWYLDRHKKTRWRYRRAGKTVQLPGDPAASDTFREAYEAAVEGRPVRQATVVRLSTAAIPRSLRAAYNLLRTSNLEWKALDPETQRQQSRVIERFLCSPIAEKSEVTFGETLFEDLRRKDVKKIIADRSDTPHAASILLRYIRKLSGVALDEEWIEYDPTYRVKYRPALKGHPPWPDKYRAMFEKRWPIGTTPRTAYALALYFGHRRSDVATTKWEHLEVGGANITQYKKRRGGKRKSLWIPIHPELQEVLEGADQSHEHVIVTAFGKPFSIKGLSTRMREWCEEADIPQGYTLHGLRKTLGKTIAERGGTTRQTMSVLGHDDIKQGETYTRDAEQRILAREAMKHIGSLKPRTG